MSTRGRGYGSRGYGPPRGGYRGSYRGSSSRGTYGGGRGGRGGYYSTDRYGGGGDRFSGRMDDGGYKKSYRSDGQFQYSSRDYGGRMSPERKRMRMEGPTGDRRSHDGGNHYGGSGGYGARRDYSDRRAEHRRSPSREMYRKSPMRTPTSGGGRSIRSGPPRRSRGSLRGRGFRGRASFRSRILPALTRALRYRPKIVKLRSAVRAKHDTASSTEGEDWDTQEEKKIMKEEGIEPAEESPKNEDETVEANEEAEDAGSGKEAAGAASGDEPEDEKIRSKLTGRVFIPLTCTHCKDKCITFKVYARHLISHRHKIAMSALALRHNQKLAMMRARQRAEQRRLEDEAAPETLQTRTIFCAVCKLNHRSTQLSHQKSEAHLQIKRFLMPFCQICRLTLRSPMQYEHHLLSLEHIKRKARYEAIKAEKGDAGSGDDGLNVDLDNFMTLDSVGDADEVDDSDTEKKNGETVEKKKTEINVGSEHIKKVEVQYCDLCKIFIARGLVTASEEEYALRRHCRMRLHLTRYVRHRDTRVLRQHAERIHRIHQMQAAADTVKKEKSENVNGEDEAAESSMEKSKELKSESANSTGANLEETEGEEKLWADVDKDLGDLLREVDQVDGNKSSDDEEESNIGRYDRFRKSEKKSDNVEDVNGDADAPPAEVKSEKTVAQPAAAADAKQAA